MNDARQTFYLPDPFAMHRGGSLRVAQVAYETWGTLNADASNAVLIFTGLSPSAHATSSAIDRSAGWWEDMVGPCHPIDTERFFVICINSLGSCFGTTGPASPDPATGKPYRLSFPVLSLEDIANCGAHLLDHLGIRQLAAVVGCSMGGMTALAFCMMHPKSARNLISISSAARALPFSIALRSLQRELLRSDPDWQAGQYEPGKGPLAGMRLARKLGMITYRSAQEWRERFGRERIAQTQSGEMFDPEFEVESYLRAQANKFTGAFDANCYLYLSRASDLFDAADHGGSLKAGIGKVALERALVIGVHTDILFPIDQQEQLATLLADHGTDVVLERLDSIQGHDSFLVDMDSFRPPVAKFFDEIEK